MTTTMLELARKLQTSQVVRILATALFIGLAGSFLGLKVAGTWDEVSEHWASIDIWWLVLSIPVLYVAFTWFGMGWLLILTKLGQRFVFLQVFHIWYRAQFGKYVPGLGLMVVGRVYWCSQVGIPPRFTITSTTIEAGMMVVTGGLVGLSIVLWSGDAGLLQGRIRYVGLVLAAVLVGAVMLHPAILNKLLLRFSSIHVGVRLTYRDSLELLITYIFRWIVVGIGFFFLTKAVYPLAVSEAPYIVASFGLAWTIGFLVIFAPGGIGVREGILVLLLDQVMPTGAALLVAGLGRLWWMSGEIGLFIISAAAVYLSGRRLGGQDAPEGTNVVEPTTSG